MRICGNCVKYQCGKCTESGTAVVASEVCDKWRYQYEPLVFAVARMRKAQKAKGLTLKQAQNQKECEKYVDDMLEQIEKTGEIAYGLRD